MFQVAQLLDCLANNQNCTLANQFLGSILPANRPMSRYIGVWYQVYGGSDAVTLRFLWILTC